MNICGLMKVTLLDFPGHVACTVFAGGCNFRCPFCHNSELLGSDAPPVMTVNELYSFLEKRQGRLEGIAFTGGEPTLNPELKDVMSHIRECYGMKIKLDTNGTNPAMLSELIEEGLVDYVAMDIKSGPSNYAKAAGVELSDDMWKKIIASKDILIKEESVKSEFRTTVVGGLHTEADFTEIRDFIEGAEQYFLQSYVESTNVLCLNKGFYEPDRAELEKYLEIVRPAVHFAAIRGVE